MSFKGRDFEIIVDENLFSAETAADMLDLDQCLSLELLRCVESNKKLFRLPDGNLTDGSNTYNVADGSPILYPLRIQKAWHGKNLPLKIFTDPLLQYALLSRIKQSGEINAPTSSIPYRKHQWRFSELCKDLKGLVLDIGCDVPATQSTLLPNTCSYIGLDPYSGAGSFRIIGLGEILPFASKCFNACLFNTSLDHILDYKTALDEAHRVLAHDGKIMIATYAWIERLTLLTDAVHFHHFTEEEILNYVSRKFKIEKIIRYEDPKHDTHRYGLYVCASKRELS